MREHDDRQAGFRKSSYSGAANANCVEVKFVGDETVVTDSAAGDGQELRFTPAEWDAFVGGVRLGEFDSPAAGGRFDEFDA